MSKPPTDFDLFGDVAGAARGGALEGHVLEHVGDAHLGRRLVAAAGVHPDADGGAFERGMGSVTTVKPLESLEISKVMAPV